MFIVPVPMYCTANEKKYEIQYITHNESSWLTFYDTVSNVIIVTRLSCCNPCHCLNKYLSNNKAGGLYMDGLYLGGGGIFGLA